MNPIHPGQSPKLTGPSGLGAPHPGRGPQEYGTDPPRYPDTATRRRPHALVVADDRTFREANVWCLRAGGWIVEEASSGAEALVAVATFGPDAIVLDAGLRDVDWRDLLRLFRRGDPEDQPALIVCGQGDRVGVQSIEAVVAAGGGDGFIARPFPPEDLRALVESLVMRRSGATI